MCSRNRQWDCDSNKEYREYRNEELSMLHCCNLRLLRHFGASTSSRRNSSIYTCVHTARSPAVTTMTIKKNAGKICNSNASLSIEMVTPPTDPDPVWPVTIAVRDSVPFVPVTISV